LTERRGLIDIVRRLQEASIEVKAMERRVIIAILEFFLDDPEHDLAAGPIRLVQILGTSSEKDDERDNHGREPLEASDARRPAKKVLRHADISSKADSL
jgi:hypothetical protein